MNKLFFPVVLLAALFAMSGCSEKFNVAAPYKNITVIYAFLDRVDTAHYIRIQKAFLDQNKSALVMSQNADSNFYANINVKINRISISDTGHIADSIHLTRVNLDNEGYPKQPGAFFNSPNYAYKFKGDLNPKYFYRIVVTNLATGESDSSTAPIIDDVTTSPITFFTDVIGDSLTNRAGIDFSSTQPNQTFDMNILYQPLADFSWNGLTSPVYLAHPVVRFNWVDSNYVTLQKTPHYYDFVLGDRVMSGNAILVQTKTTAFYSAIASGLGAAPANTVRLMDRSDIFVYLSTYDYYNYEQATLTQGVGLTGNEIEPIYTNIKGANALGLYTSRGVQSGKITITINTIDSMIASPMLTNTRISGTVYH